jgi:hypothetical protein
MTAKLQSSGLLGIRLRGLRRAGFLEALRHVLERGIDILMLLKMCASQGRPRWDTGG